MVLESLLVWTGDCWFRAGNKRSKDPLLDRHGFGQIVKDARSDTIKTITRLMQREAGRKVVATNKSSQSEKNELYEEWKCLTKPGRFYVVTPMEKQVSSEVIHTSTTMPKWHLTWNSIWYRNWKKRNKGNHRIDILYSNVSPWQRFLMKFFCLQVKAKLPNEPFSIQGLKNLLDDLLKTSIKPKR